MDALSPLPPAPERLKKQDAVLMALLALGAHIRFGKIIVTLPDGSLRSIGGQNSGPTAFIHIHSPRMARRFLLGGILGFCESYLDGEWSSPDRMALFETTMRNEAVLQGLIDGNPFYRLWQGLQHTLNRNSKRGSRRNIQAHYDLGNDFYRLWLDDSMTYSAALFGPDLLPNTRISLAAAQIEKIKHLADMMQIAPGHHVLEIGCGWGACAEYLAGQRGCRVTALTISPAQRDYALARIQRAGLNERVEIRLQDYRDTREVFDRIISIEMIEAVGERYWPRYFGTLHDRLVPGGVVGLQGILLAERFWDVYRRGSDFIQKHIFPGGMLMTERLLYQHFRNVGLTVRDQFNFGQHYAETLEEWQRRFQSAWPAVARLGFDARFKRLWELYLDYCATGFRVGTIDVLQITAQRN